MTGWESRFTNWTFDECLGHWSSGFSRVPETNFNLIRITRCRGSFQNNFHPLLSEESLGAAVRNWRKNWRKSLIWWRTYWALCPNQLLELQQTPWRSQWRVSDRVGGYSMHHGMICRTRWLLPSGPGCSSISEESRHCQNLRWIEPWIRLVPILGSPTFWMDDSINKVGSPFPTSGVLSLIDGGTNWQGLCLASVVTE